LGIPAKGGITIEAAGASGGLAVHQAFIDIKAGARNILVCGVEKMSDALPSYVYSAKAMMEDWQYLFAVGASFEALQGILLRMYLDQYNAPHENIMMVAVVSHKHAVTAEHAQFRREITVDTIKKSPLVADPLHLFEITAPGDGAAALVLSSETGDSEILASSIAGDRFRFFERENPLWLDSVYLAAQKAYEEAKLTLDDIDLIEIHDTSTILGVLEIEALGLAEKGEGHKFFSEGKGFLNGEKPVNTFGGAKARGDPIGATGVYQIVEIVKQLVGDAGKNQVDNAKAGLALAVGGIGALSVVHILRKVK